MFINDVKDVIKEAVMDGLPIAIWGPSGAGKSAIGRAAAKELSEDTGEEFQYIDIRLSQYEPTDLRGVLVPDMKARKGVWLPPSTLPTDPDWVGIIMFDEISSAVPMVQAAAYQLFLDRKIGEYELPAGAQIIAAGNRLSDKGVVFPMAAPLANRFGGHLELELSLEQWKWWAYDNDQDPDIISFLSYAEHYLHKFDPASKEKGFPTPRSWEFGSRILQRNVKPHIKKEWMAGCIGSAACEDFWSYRELVNGVASTETILDLKQDYILPSGEAEIGAIHNINTSIIQRLKQEMGQRPDKGPKLKEDEVLAIFRYLNKINMEDMRVAAFKEFTSNKLPIIGTPYKKAKEAFDAFYGPISHLIPQD